MSIFSSPLCSKNIEKGFQALMVQKIRKVSIQSSTQTTQQLKSIYFCIVKIYLASQTCKQIATRKDTVLQFLSEQFLYQSGLMKVIK